jgi:mono/diheme cytochrome c family protein
MKNMLILGLVAALASSVGAAEPPLDYNRQVRPLLSNHCFKCHGPDAGQRKGGFRLDVRESAVAAAGVGRKAGCAGR